MIRTQIQLTETQAIRLKELAGHYRVSIAELIRRGIDAFLGNRTPVDTAEPRRRAAAVVGRFRSGRKDLSAKHDEHLAEAYRS